MIRIFILSIAAGLALTAWTPPVQAGTRVSVGIGLGGGFGYGGPGYCGSGRGYYGGGYYGGHRGYGFCEPYYRPYYAPIYYAPPPVVYVEQPIYQQPVYQPVYVQEQRYTVNAWQVSQVQAQLGRMRYYSGVADGVVGPKTRSAVARFQQARGLVVSGNINSQVLNALEIPL